MLIKKQLKFVTELSHKYNLPPQVIEVICNHPFLFASERIREADSKPIMFTYLGKIKMKNRYAKKDSKDNKDAK